jgi:hypothetical protein
MRRAVVVRLVLGIAAFVLAGRIVIGILSR